MIKMESLAKEAREVIQSAQISDVSRGKRATFEELEEHKHKWVRGWTDEPEWLNFGFVFDGIDVQDEVAPETRRFIDTLKTDFIVRMAGFSWLKGMSEIPVHADEFYTRCIIVHIPLIVPSSGECYITVNGTRMDYKYLVPLCFVDHFPHAVFNHSPDDRVVLYLKLEPRADSGFKDALVRALQGFS